MARVRGGREADVTWRFGGRVTKREGLPLYAGAEWSTGIFTGLKICALVTMWVHNTQRGRLCEICPLSTLPTLA